MQEMSKRHVLKTLAALSAGASAGGVGAATDRPTDERAINRLHGNRPDFTILNNRGRTEDVTVSLLDQRNETVFSAQRDVTTAESNVDDLPFRTTLDLPKLTGGDLRFQLKVDGEVRSEFPLGIGESGIPDYGNVHVDLREDREKIGYSVV